MDKLIIGIAGKKGSGKNTFVNQVAAQYLDNVMDETFSVDDEGRLYNKSPESNILNSAADIFTTTIDVISFADPLKEFCISQMGLGYGQCWGTDADKNTLTEYMWEDAPGYTGDRTGQMTGREVMQYFGTDIMRTWNPDIWINSCIRKVLKGQGKIVMIPDCRFVDEVEAIKAIPDAKMVRLKRNPYNDQHTSEVALDNVSDSEFDLVVPDLPSVAAQGDFIRDTVEGWLRDIRD